MKKEAFFQIRAVDVSFRSLAKQVPMIKPAEYGIYFVSYLIIINILILNVFIFREKERPKFLWFC